jgi:cysteine desulfurase
MRIFQQIDMKEIYLDNAAATPLDPRVLKAMQPYFLSCSGNPSSFHAQGLCAKEAVMKARNDIATILNCREDNVLFTSGGTESDNMAVVGIAHATRNTQHVTNEITHVITSAIEHPAVLEPLKHLQKIGNIELTVLPVDKSGLVDPKSVVDAMRPDTVLVSIMYANNEIGTVQPIAQIGKEILKWRKTNSTALPYFHSDACQAAGACELDVEKLHVDALTLNGSKIYGPKGVGVLYLRRGVAIDPLLRGGGQERNLRAGTENVPAIVGLAKALELVQSDRESEQKRLIALRDRLIEGLLAIPKTRLNGHQTKRLPNNVNISFLDIEGEAAVLYLDAKKIYASTGSACASSTLEPSHVILAIGVSYEAAHGSLRFTLGRQTTLQDVERVIKVTADVVKKLRVMSPVDLDMKYFS